jgi:2-polyprenyl-3-methyl-5-hydroxy-6-metoxy-1,4-benzoquinol methylase
MKCRHCNNNLDHEFINLINSPPSNSFLTEAQLDAPEVYYPLRLFVCDSCWLVQIAEYKKSTEIFNSNYAYFSSFSRSWLAHCKQYAKDMIARFQLTGASRVVEIASNDGYLLQYFKERDISVLGIEPTENTAAEARKKGIETIVKFFGQNLARELRTEGIAADLLAGNNVLAHVPDINDFVAGMKTLLKAEGVITMEFPHLLSLVRENQFDTIYHEHFSYLSLHTVSRIFTSNGLEVFDVEEIPTHGGSLRIYAKHIDDSAKTKSTRVASLLEREELAGICSLQYYGGFQAKAESIKLALLHFLLTAKSQGKHVIGYGAAAKGNTLLNFCGIKNDLIDYVVDASPHKQGLFLPGSHIPVISEESIRTSKPQYILILPWNLDNEIKSQLQYVKEWGAQFVTAIPELRLS